MNLEAAVAIVALVAAAAIILALTFVAVPSLAVLTAALIALVKTFGFVDIVVVWDINIFCCLVLFGQGNS